MKKQDFLAQFFILDGFSDVQKECDLKYLRVTFSTGSLFDVENNFKSTLHFDFGLAFYEDVDLDNAEDEVFLENRISNKKRFLELLEITPNVEVSTDNLVLYPNSGAIILDLQPETEYSFSLKSFDSQIEGQSVKPSNFTFTTPKNSFFGLRIQEKVSLFRDSNQPNFELISQNTDIREANIQICRITNEDYAKIEVFRERKGFSEEKKDFFTSGIDKLKHYECQEKTVAFNTNEGNSQKQQFNFADLIGESARSGLYYVTFANLKDRIFQDRVQNPLFFGIIDSHIMMKVSKNGKAFFFVNDLNGKPLSGQKIRAYANEFISQEKVYNQINDNYDINLKSPLEKNIFSGDVLLGETNEEGVLEVDMKGKLDDVFGKTISAYNFDWDGNHNSFFVSSACETNLSYVSSKWNGGITAWNFGYSLGSGWWYGDSQNMDAIELETWRQAEPTMYSHTYTDRRLYLPGEQVHIKSLVRNSQELGIEKGKKLRLTVQNPKGEVVSDDELEVNEFGSLYKKLQLESEALLGNYEIQILSGDERVGQSGFTVEIFKNPKFKNEVMLQTDGLNKEIVADVQIKPDTENKRYSREIYTSEFQIQASVQSQYYSGAPVKNSDFTYKVYKQYFYDSSYWDECFYGCYWEPQKELYTEGKGKLDANGNANLNIPVKFESEYQDYKYIVEVSVTDQAGDTISGSNSIIARLPEQYKGWNPESGVYFTAQKRFYKQGETFEIEGGLNQGDFTSEYEKDFILIIKKKNYETKIVKDVRGYDRPITRSSEKIEKVFRVNKQNFTLKNGKLSLKYKLPETGEYVFEFGKIDDIFLSIPNEIPDSEKEKVYDEIIAKLIENPNKSVDLGLQKISYGYDGYSLGDYLSKTCVGSSDECDRNTFNAQIRCLKNNGDIISEEVSLEQCKDIASQDYIEMYQRIGIEDILENNSKKYFTLISYGDAEASNPVKSDNKIDVLSEKVSYKLGETARVLVRLPMSQGKILWTVEKQGVVSHEYIDVPGNTFFKEILVDDTFVPNAYIGVTVIDTNTEKTPEYKVGYTEIVVDKTDKKSKITLKTNKKTYEPREEVVLNLGVTDNSGNKKPSELTVMVVDDSLISLMGNIDANALEKFYKKLPFQIQTSITNVAMLRNYYFSRQGIVGGSGFGNFKGGDSAVSSRNIFKNTAYYNESVVTNEDGTAEVRFTLPDNLTNFRVMVLSNSKDNLFGYVEDFIEVRKDVIVEDRTPLILRENDEIILGANVFNTTKAEIGFKAVFTADGLIIDTPEKTTIIKGGESEFITFKVKNPKTCGYLETKCEIPYMISILGDSAKNSDKIEGKIKIVSVPSLIQNVTHSEILSVGETGDLSLKLPENTDVSKSSYSFSFSNNPLLGIEKIVKSLAVYPFGCGEQLLSSTMPNAVLKRFEKIIADTGIQKSETEKNLSAGLEKIYEMSLDNGGFKYWYHDTDGNIHITAYGVRVLLEIQRSGTKIDTQILDKALSYLVQNYENASGIEKAESLWAIADYHREKTASILKLTNLGANYNPEILERHELIAYTYALVLANKEKYKNTIDTNISRITKLLDSGDQGTYYYSDNSDTGEFTQMLIDYKGDPKMIAKYINELYQIDWESYWYSTKTKNNAFLAFVKYIEVFGKDSINTLELTLSGETREIKIGETNNNYSQKIGLKEVLKNETVELKIKNISGEQIFTNAKIQAYPSDPLKIKKFSNDVTLERKIYEVVDESDLQESCMWNNGDRTCAEAQSLKLHTGDTFKKGATYKIVLKSQFTKSQNRQNLTMEDYLPSGFTILNSNFKTNSIATNQETTEGNSWEWSHIEKRPEVVMAHSDNTWGQTARYEYFVRADYEGSFIYPPAVVYLMYQPDTRANTEFRRVIIKKGE